MQKPLMRYFNTRHRRASISTHDCDILAKTTQMIEWECVLTCLVSFHHGRIPGGRGCAEPGEFGCCRSSVVYSRAHVGKLNFVMRGGITILRLVISRTSVVSVSYGVRLKKYHD